ncbi:hypothetical protein QYM36_000165 [Artemia franciscana]|uniref:RING-type E3 ubiquitin transferase n=1 Tax=Artemia franciscana TaxID=6661 RepID=A0AA88IPS7_ARTSF|nr:hypothetical protein QYM36_000165 [Artemia franciscana]
MTDARVEIRHYYCYECEAFFYLSMIDRDPEDYTCPFCLTGFVQEVSMPLHQQSAPLEMYTPHMPHRHMMDIRHILGFFFAGEGLSFTGNSRDYAWGNQDLDRIIAELFNQAEERGPPPMPKEKIQNLERVKIAGSEDHQCTICYESYKLQESVTKLPCDHLFHNDCIVPWLELHCTCPVCRRSFLEEEEKTSIMNPADYRIQAEEGSSQELDNRLSRSNPCTDWDLD